VCVSLGKIHETAESQSVRDSASASCVHVESTSHTLFLLHTHTHTHTLFSATVNVGTQTCICTVGLISSLEMRLNSFEPLCVNDDECCSCV